MKPASPQPSLAASTLLSALFFALGPVIYAAPLAATSLLPAVTLAAWWLAYDQGLSAIRRDLAGGWAWAPLLAVMVASAAWSMAPGASLILAARLIVLVCCGIILTGILRRFSPAAILRIMTALAWGLCVASVIVLGDLAIGGRLVRAMHNIPPVLSPAEGYSRGNVFHALAIVPLAIGLWRGGQRRLAVAQFVLGSAAILCCIQLAAKLALGCGIVGGALVLAAPAFRWALPVALVALATVLPWALPVTLSPAHTCWLISHKPSAMHRVLIWDWVDARIRERPVLGWGLDAARRMPGGHEQVVLARCDAAPGELPPVDGEILPLHPHDAVLQIWLELGGVGMLAALFGLVWSLWEFFRRHRGRAAAPLAAMVSAGLAAALISFGIWQEWWVAVMLLTAAASVGLARAEGK